MDRLWAPWRAKYVKETTIKKSECLFCSKIKADKALDRDNLVLLRGNYCFILMNLFPYNAGHLMIAPYKHTANIEDLNDNEFLDIKKMLTLSIKTLKQVMNPEGFNVGFNIGKAAGAGVAEHIHMHIVPRWNGDTNAMTVIGNIRVIPEDLFETYDALLKFISKKEEL